LPLSLNLLIILGLFNISIGALSFVPSEAKRIDDDDDDDDFRPSNRVRICPASTLGRRVDGVEIERGGEGGGGRVLPFTSNRNAKRLALRPLPAAMSVSPPCVVPQSAHPLHRLLSPLLLRSFERWYIRFIFAATARIGT
jgi:hypothetical protein